jgi:hypothetical protein
MIEGISIDKMAGDGAYVAAKIVHADENQVVIELSSADSCGRSECA